MWFKLFILVRLPISVLSLGGFSIALGAWGDAGMEALWFFLVTGLLGFLGVISVKLYQLQSGALQLAWWLLALEVAGAVLFIRALDMAAGRNLGNVAIWAGTVLLLWALPNALLFYKARALFSEPANEKSGL